MTNVTKTEIIVKSFFGKKGFGFFTHSDGFDIFVHATTLKKFGFSPQDMLLQQVSDISFKESRDGKFECLKILSIGDKTAKEAESFVSQRPQMSKLQLGQRVVGSLKFFNHEKGFGFIDVVGSDDLFVHITGVPDNLVNSLNIGVQYSLVVGEAEDGRLLANLQHVIEKKRQHKIIQRRVSMHPPFFLLR